MNPHIALGLALLASATAGAADVAVLPNVSITASEVIELWPGAAPGETRPLGPEHVLPDRPRPFDQIADVTVPTLSIFLPAPEKRTGTGMLVIPGGGLERLAIEHEGYEVAAWLNEHGIAAFLLKYRVPPRDPQQRWKVGVQDAQRAMSLIRARAEVWQVDRDALGTIGFSAGAEINVRLSVYDNERQYAPVDAADTWSTRPDFNIPIYSGGIADPRGNTLHDDITSRLDARAPPMFIVHAFDDGALSSIILMNALKRANVASELHIFGAGGHGFGVRDSGLPFGTWRELSLNWLRWQGFLDVPAVRAYARVFAATRNHRGSALPRFSATVPEAQASLSSAFAAQHRLVRAALATGAEIAGYKGAFTSLAAQTSFGINGPLHAVLFKSGRLEAVPAPRVPFDSANPLLIETEIGYVIAVDIGSKLLLPRQATTAVEAVVPVIELPHDVRPRMGGTVNALDLVATNVASNQFIVGPAFDPHTIADLDAVTVSLRRDGVVVHESTGADANGGQAVNLMTLINQIIDQGHVIRRGDIIISGALGGARPAGPGSYTADFGPLGAMNFTLE